MLQEKREGGLKEKCFNVIRSKFIMSNAALLEELMILAEGSAFKMYTVDEENLNTAKTAMFCSRKDIHFCFITLRIFVRHTFGPNGRMNTEHLVTNNNNVHLYVCLTHPNLSH